MKSRSYDNTGQKTEAHSRGFRDQSEVINYGLDIIRRNSKKRYQTVNSEKVVIAASIDEVWNTIIDFENYNKWQRGTMTYAPFEVPLQVGANTQCWTLAMSQTRSRPLDLVVTEWEPMRRFGYDHGTRIRYELSDVSGGVEVVMQSQGDHVPPRLLDFLTYKNPFKVFTYGKARSEFRNITTSSPFVLKEKIAGLKAKVEAGHDGYIDISGMSEAIWREMPVVEDQSLSSRLMNLRKRLSIWISLNVYFMPGVQRKKTSQLLYTYWLTHLQTNHYLIMHPLNAAQDRKRHIRKLWELAEFFLVSATPIYPPVIYGISENEHEAAFRTLFNIRRSYESVLGEKAIDEFLTDAKFDEMTRQVEKEDFSKFESSELAALLKKYYLPPSGWDTHLNAIERSWMKRLQRPFHSELESDFALLRKERMAV